MALQSSAEQLTPESFKVPLLLSVFSLKASNPSQVACILVATHFPPLQLFHTLDFPFLLLFRFETSIFTSNYQSLVHKNIQ